MNQENAKQRSDAHRVSVIVEHVIQAPVMIEVTDNDEVWKLGAGAVCRHNVLVLEDGVDSDFRAKLLNIYHLGVELLHSNLDRIYPPAPGVVIALAAATADPLGVRVKARAWPVPPRKKHLRSGTFAHGLYNLKLACIDGSMVR